MSDELSVGDFVYQADQELFLVVTDVTDTSYQFAVHGWREIDKSRLQEYLETENGFFYRQDDITEVIADADSKAAADFAELKKLFEVYESNPPASDGPTDSFTLEDS